MDKSALKAVNFEKIKEITRGPDENPSLFYCQLVEAMIKYTHLTSETNYGRFYLRLHYISQSIPDICQKFQKLQDAPEIAQAHIIKAATKIFNNKEEEQKT
jgi:hypothetical protein